MKITETTSKLEFKKMAITTSFGEVLQPLSDEEIQATIKEAIAKKHMENLKYYHVQETKFVFNSFQIDENLLKKYDEKDKKIYEHFVYHHLRNYFSTNRNSDHYHNGGYWRHERYDPSFGLHLYLLDKNASKSFSSHEYTTIRNSILFHFYSASIIRMYGTPQYYKTIRDFDDTTDRIKFLDFIIDTNMVDINKKMLIKNSKKEDTEKFNNRYSTFGEALVYHCIRNFDLEALKYLVEVKKLDLYKINNTKNPDDNKFLYRLLGNIIGSNYKDDFETYYNNNSKSTSEDKDMVDFFSSLYTYIKKMFPEINIKNIYEESDDIDISDPNFDEFSWFMKTTFQK